MSTATAWHALDPDEVATALGTDPQSGLGRSEVAARQRRYGPNEIASEPGPSAGRSRRPSSGIR